MPLTDYSKFDKIVDSDSDEDKGGQPCAEAEEDDILKNLPQGLSPGLSLVFAARHGQCHVVEALLKAKAPVDFADPHGGTALLRAVEGGIGNRPIIELLLKHKASVESRSNDGQTPMECAAASGPAELVEAMLQHSNSSDVTRGKALVAAAAGRNKSIVQNLLASRAAVSMIGSSGSAAIHVAAAVGDLDLTKALVSAGTDVNMPDTEGRTPLMHAARGGHVPVAEWFCKNGSAVDAVASDGRTALLFAAESCPNACAESMLRALLNNGATPEATGNAQGSPTLPSPVIAAILAGRRAESVGLLLDVRADARAADGVGRRPLPCAAAAGDLRLCRLLLEHRASVGDTGTSGADGHAQNGRGVTPLSISAAAGNSELTALFLSEDAAVTDLDERRRTPLMAAAQFGSAECCASLLAARAEVDARQDESGKTALIFAAGAGHAETCGVLLEAGACVDARAATGATSLHAAASNGHEAVCRRLLASGADVKMKGPGEKDAISLASDAGHTVVVSLLTGSSAPGA